MEGLLRAILFRDNQRGIPYSASYRSTGMESIARARLILGRDRHTRSRRSVQGQSCANQNEGGKST